MSLPARHLQAQTQVLASRSHICCQALDSAHLDAAGTFYLRCLLGSSASRSRTGQEHAIPQSLLFAHENGMAIIASSCTVTQTCRNNLTESTGIAMNRFMKSILAERQC